ncbi:MAG: serine/threonine protein kinase [Deltaproteobacteria bacterium]|nr:serine/threonine protein kinase [Deltaproteobacteria bacterium]
MWKVGDRLGRFRLDREIGQGSHGVVFVATDTALDTLVAVKILHPWLTQDTAVRDRFKRELLLARRIAHPGVCRLFDLHEEGEAFFITMEFVEGQTLLSILKNEGRLQPLRAVRILRGVCQALSAAHQAGVIHRDLKPANIIVRAGEAPMILDFGTATAGDVSRVTRPGTAVGSMRFIAPEVFTGVSPSISTDVYSLGVVSYVVLAGKLPYNAAAGAIEMLELIRTQPPARLDVVQPDIPKGLADVVAKAMEKAPDARYKSAKDLDDALAGVEAEMTGAPPPASAALPQPPVTTADAPAKTLPATPAAKADVTQVTSPAAVASLSAGKGDLEAAFASAFGGAPAANAEPTKVAPVQALAQAEDEEDAGLAGKTAVDVQAPDVTLGSLAPAGATELPLVTGVVEVSSAEQREIAGEHGTSGDDALTSEAPRPVSIPSGEPKTSGEGTFAVRTDPETGGRTEEAPEPSSVPPPLPAAAPTVVVTNPIEPTVRVARPDLDFAEARAVAKGPPKGILIAAGVGAVAVIGFIALIAGGDDEDTVADADAGTDVLVVTQHEDAGELAAVDAGAVEAATDAGTEDGVDAGEEVLDFGDIDAGPDLVPPDVPGVTPKRPKADPVVDGKIRAVRAAMTKKGLITGDLPKAEADLVRAHFIAMRDKRAEADRLVADAKAAVDGQKIDRALVLSKLARFNSKYDKKKRADVADKVEPLAREAGQAFAAGNYEDANKKLNRAFALLGKTK